MRYLSSSVTKTLFGLLILSFVAALLPGLDGVKKRSHEYIIGFK